MQNLMNFYFFLVLFVDERGTSRIVLHIGIYLTSSNSFEILSKTTYIDHNRLNSRDFYYVLPAYRWHLYRTDLDQLEVF
ncbi:hypothetical protein HanRHA438_Chr03g0121361 [Helianthus annuus]|nr:hypothetical protein HanRHA438_Chr03g0121361 [Helianthus annuus]